MKFPALIAIALAFAASLFAQSTSLSGVTTDPAGAAVANAAITVTNTKTGLEREAKSDAQGHYLINELPPGTYRLSAKAPGFSEAVVNNIEIDVSQPANVAVKFQLGATSTTVSVEASAVQVNTVDASLGNVITSQAITELPSALRSVANLLTLEPGVTSFGGNDDRNGSINGGRSDQSNYTLDGVDVNQQSNRAAFSTVLRVTPDTVEEFRTTTTNGGADVGRGSGADVTLVTKSGTNSIHGALYEYRRGTETAANSFFNNKAGLPIAALLINQFGAAVGGPIKKNKAFYFMNYEGRRDASSSNVTRNVPTETLKQGIVQFHNAGGALTSIGPDQLKTIDPLGIGVDPAVLAVLKQYPAGNDPALGDGLNFTGYLFTAPQHAKQDTYTAKLDYKVDNAGKHSVFVRGVLQNDHQAGTPQFPGAQPNSTTLANNKGIAAGWTGVFTSSLVNTVRYGLTRQGGETTGILAGSPVTFRNIDPIYGTSTGLSRIIPVHNLGDDLAWNHGSHDFKFGGSALLISNRSVSSANSFNNATTNASVLNGSGNNLVPSSISLSKGDTTTYEYSVAALLGIVTSATGNYNYTTSGSVIPVGAPVSRNFVNHEGELYAQDSWRIKSNLTLTYGVRLSIMPPVHEANGQQITTNIPIGTWFDTRGGLADQGRSDQGAGSIEYLVGPGRGYYPSHNEWAPRLAIAYSPHAQSGLAKLLFGGAGKTSIRAGAGMYYDIVGQPLAGFISNNSFGLSNSLTTPPNVYNESQLPRFTGFYNIPAAPNAPLFLQPAPPAGFPVSYPNAFAITSSLDDQMKAPYTMNLNFSIGREFANGWFVQGSYVGRLSRHNLVQRDLAMPTNLTDPKSGQTYFQAMTQLGTLIDLQGVSIANLPKIPFFENMWATAGGNGYTPTQVIGLDYTQRSNQGDFTNVQSDMDNGQNCGKVSTFNAAGKLTQTACGVLGAYSMFSPQYSALNTWSSVGSGAYHSMQWTVTKRFTSNFLLGLNYTLSKSLDIGSRVESSGGFSADFMINSWNAHQLRAVSRYDALQQANAYLVYQVPIGRGKHFGTTMNKALDAIVGGWQISGTWRQTSGLPFSVSDGSRWSTDWQLSSFATPNGQPIPTIISSHNATAISGPGGPNLWANPALALASFQETMDGQTGSRDSLRGAGFFNIDSNLSKSFSMPWSEKQKLQLRWEAYNVTNTIKFDPNSANLSLTSTAKFGQLTGQLGSPRQMEFALRYTF